MHLFDLVISPSGSQWYRNHWLFNGNVSFAVKSNFVYVLGLFLFNIVPDLDLMWAYINSIKLYYS